MCFSKVFDGLMKFSSVKLILNIPKNTESISKSNLSYLQSIYYSIFVLYKLCNLQKLWQVHNKFQKHIVIAILQIIKHQIIFVQRFSNPVFYLPLGSWCFVARDSQRYPSELEKFGLVQTVFNQKA